MAMKRTYHYSLMHVHHLCNSVRLYVPRAVDKSKFDNHQNGHLARLNKLQLFEQFLV